MCEIGEFSGSGTQSDISSEPIGGGNNCNSSVWPRLSVVTQRGLKICEIVPCRVHHK